MTTTVPPVNGAAAACSPHPKPGARKGGPAETASAGGKPKAATYDYTDEAGKLLFQVVRHYQGKDFDQRRPDGSGGWIWNLDGVRSVLYRLPDIRQDDFQPVFIAEREQDADALHKKMDLLATTNPGGATHGKWLPEYSKMLAGRDVMILPNNHEAGRKWAQSVAASLEPKAPMLKVVQLPGLPEGGTVSDWLAVRGNGMNSLSELVGEASEWRPSPAPTTRKTQTKSPPPPAHQVEAYKPFPIETLPAVIQDYVSQVAKALGCDPAYVALPTLAVVASAIGNSRSIRLKHGWEEPSVVWTAIVGDSGTLKSPAYLKAVAHLFAVQQQKLLEYRDELKQYRAARKKNGDEDEADADPDKPVLERVVCSDTTIEKLTEMLEDSPRGLLVARDELAGWFGSFTRYKGKAGGSDLPHWLEMHRAGSIIYDRKSGDRRSVFVPRAAVSLTGGIQPGIVTRAFSADFLEAGGGARLLMAMPNKLPKEWSELEVHPDVEQSYHRLLDKLLQLQLDDYQGERVPRVLELSAEGKEAWITFYNDWAKEQAAVQGELAAAYAKLEAYAARFALIHHAVQTIHLDPDTVPPIGAASVNAGVALVLWFAREARRIYGTLSETPAERDRRLLVAFINGRGGSITARELQRSNNRKYPTAAHAANVLDALVPGLGQWEDVPASSHGGHPTRRFTLARRMTEPTEPSGDESVDGPGVA